MSSNARGICKVSRAQRSEAELWARGILYIPEFCDVAPRAAGERATSRTEGLPARILQKERALSVSEGGAILQNVSAYLKFAVAPACRQAGSGGKYGSSDGRSEPDMLC